MATESKKLTLGRVIRAFKFFAKSLQSFTLTLKKQKQQISILTTRFELAQCKMPIKKQTITPKY